MSKSKTRRGGTDEVGAGLKDLKLPVKGSRKRPDIPDAQARQAAKTARQQRDAEVEQQIEPLKADVAASATYVAELVLDHATDDPTERFLEHQKWLHDTLFNSKGKLRQAAWVAMYKATFGVEMHSHEELNALLRWLVEQKRLTCLGKVPRGSKSRGDLFHFGTDYNWFPEAQLTPVQVKVLKSAFSVARGKIWHVVNGRWKAAPAKMRAELQCPITVEQLISHTPGDCFLRAPGKWAYRGGARRYIEGGPMVVRTDGKNLCVVSVSNELKRSDGSKAWGNFEWWFSENVVAHDDFEGILFPMEMILRGPKRGFVKGFIAVRNMACERIRDGIGYERSKSAPKPTAKATKAAAKKPRAKKVKSNS